jgi:hypothetical protein
MSLGEIKKDLNKLHHKVFYCAELKLKDALKICSELNIIETELDKLNGTEQAQETKKLSDL